MASVFTDPISGNTQITGSVTVDNISIRGLTLGATTLSSNAIWLPSTTAQWNQVFSPNLPTFTLPAGGVMSYARQKGLYRWTGNDLVYTINVAGTLTSATTSNLGDFTLNVPYPINTATYSTSTIIGELWLSSVYQNTSNIYKAYAKTIPTNTNSVAIRVLTGTADETMSTIRANTGLTLQGTMTYNTTSFNQTGGVPATYVPAMFYQNTAGQVSVNSNMPPRARLDIYENSNTPALIADQYGSGDALQVRIGGQTKLLVDAQGNLDLPGGIFLAPVSGAPHVAFNGSAANSNVFLTWLQRTTTTLAGSWWQDAATPVYSSVAISPAPASGAYIGGVLLPDGRVVFVPNNATTIGIFNTMTNTYSTILAGTPGNFAYSGGVLLPDGRVVFVPRLATTIGIFNPATNAYSTITMSPAPLSDAYLGGVLLPDGRVVFVPRNATTIGIFNPTTNSYSTVSGAPGSLAYVGGVLLPDGRVVFVPSGATTIGLFNPINNTYSTISGAPGNDTYRGGVLLPDGRVVFVPYNGTNIGLFNPITNTYSTVIMSPTPPAGSYYSGVLLPDGRVAFVPGNTTTIGIFNPATNTYSTILGAPGTLAYQGGTLLSDGRVLFVPFSATTNIGILSGFSAPPRELCYHPCFNKL
jgi:streptogramin lyase